MLGRLKDIYELANRNNVSIYALDPRGLAAFDSDIDEGAGGISLTTDRDMLRLTMDSIRVLADNTDGRAIVNSNDLARGHCGRSSATRARTTCSATTPARARATASSTRSRSR